MNNYSNIQPPPEMPEDGWTQTDAQTKAIKALKKRGFKLVLRKRRYTTELLGMYGHINMSRKRGAVSRIASIAQDGTIHGQPLEQYLQTL